MIFWPFHGIMTGYNGLISWHDILSSLRMGGPYESGLLRNQNKDLPTISTMFVIFVFCEFICICRVLFCLINVFQVQV